MNTIFLVLSTYPNKCYLRSAAILEQKPGLGGWVLKMSVLNAHTSMQAADRPSHFSFTSIPNGRMWIKTLLGSLTVSCCCRERLLAFEQFEVYLGLG